MISTKRENAMTEVDNYGSDILGLLVKASNDPDKNKRITVETVVDECKALYFGGHETTTTLLAWSVLLLAIHREWQEEARKEVLELFGQQHPNAEGIPKMKKIHDIMLGGLGSLIMSNDEYRSVEHRVLANPHEEPRVSIAVFFNSSNRERLYGPLPELVSPEKPALYQQFTLSDCMQRFFSKELQGKTLTNYYRL
ncbi:hypothetical protein HYC85_013251 [Camellia sinensis]|uniref:Isopenicillin N synthase-like Fe(2+) 2OG dioxygenase domain-containing protein n=1 Tax=Camellia sinensis TaxID=4442 RepID=A0A7J7H618_CAMSI|nr:hypothetical protein HYC85_013251 [Camellia sinensis]